ncbi:hypothetical protein Leryth_007259 [Lithospermum erythrorhizon]|nr:hypothetical protein Leryth_007259 [Lithospermum erythrorhizon]
MLRLKAYRPTNDKIVKIHMHPTHPWLVTADASDHVSVWNWEHRQVIYELKAGGVDERRLVGAKLEKLAEGESQQKLYEEGGNDRSLKNYVTPFASEVKPDHAIVVSFYDDDVRFWQLWRNRFAAAEAPSAVNNATFSTPAPVTKGRHFLVICCENKAIFLDLVTMRGRDVPKSELDNRSLIWQLARRYTGGHKGSISCLMTFMAASGEALLVSGGSDGLLILWSADYGHDSKELVPKLSLKKIDQIGLSKRKVDCAHDGGVTAVELSRVSGSAPQLITIGADKTLAIWDTMTFKEIRRIKPVSKLACHSVSSWCHPRAPNLDILTCVKDSHIW